MADSSDSKGVLETEMGAARRAHFAKATKAERRAVTTNTGNEPERPRRSPETDSGQAVALHIKAGVAREWAAHQTCHSTKRTHFEFDDFFMYFRYSQALMTFEEAFANGFVLEKRTHLEALVGSFSSRIPKLTPMHHAINVTRHAQR